MNIDRYVNLTYLNLSFNSIIDITPIGLMKQLKHLNLNHNKIIFINSLISLTNLELLNISNNNISEIDDLSSLIHLNELWVANNPISFKDYIYLKPLKNLRKLILSLVPLPDYLQIYGFLITELPSLITINGCSINNDKIISNEIRDISSEYKFLDVNYLTGQNSVPNRSKSVAKMSRDNPTGNINVKNNDNNDINNNTIIKSISNNNLTELNQLGRSKSILSTLSTVANSDPITNIISIKYQNKIQGVLLKSDGTISVKYQNNKTAIVVDHTNTGYAIYGNYINGMIAFAFSESGAGGIYSKKGKTLFTVFKDYNYIIYKDDGEIYEKDIMHDTFKFQKNINENTTILYQPVEPFITIQFSCMNINISVIQAKNSLDTLHYIPEISGQQTIKKKSISEISQDQHDNFLEMQRLIKNAMSCLERNCDNTQTDEHPKDSNKPPS